MNPSSLTVRPQSALPYGGHGITTRFSGSSETDNELDRFFPRSNEMTQNPAAKPEKPSVILGLLGKMGIYLNRPKLGKLQLAKLIDRLQAASQQQNNFKLLAYDDSSTRQRSRFQLGDNLFSLRYKKYRWPVPTPHDRDTIFRVKNFTGYRLKSGDGRSTLRLDFAENNVNYRGKLVYTNKKTGMKLVSTDSQILASALNLLSQLNSRAQQDSRKISRQDQHIPDLEM